ncbi:unnamed protein product [Rotaria sp. Silwood2]|nr:unnamed protein product [Rotaria sp. Silwood2]CAF4291336.1 unnamed protein product [Rotaria sp. Silwood2]
MLSSNATSTPAPTSLDIAQYQFILRLVVNTLGLTILITGVLGNIINILTFTTLGYYRQNACCLYIISRSIFDEFVLIFGLGTRILSQGFQIDFTATSNVWCKLRVPIIYINTLSSYTFLCLQSIDAFLVTSLSTSLRQRSNVRTARYLLLSFLFLWIVEELPYLFFQELITSSGGSKPTCVTVNIVYAKYRTYFVYLFLTTIVPLIVIIVFDLLTYQHLHIHSTQQRRRLLSILTRQMTTMTLFHIAPVILFQAPFAVSQCYFLTVGISKEPIRAAQEQIVQQFSNVLGYGIYAVRDLVSNAKNI